jgi:uncharacterized protein (DUF1697 family)
VTTHIAFLRAVNLGRRRVTNGRLVELVKGLGHRDVWAYIASGNVVFDASGRRATLERDIRAAIEEDVGFEVTTFVRTARELDRILARDPFPVGEDDTHFVTFLLAAPTAAQARALEDLSGDFDTLVVDGREVHWRMHGRSSDSPLTKRDWDRILGPDSSTSRNATMLRRLAAKIRG